MGLSSHCHCHNIAHLNVWWEDVRDKDFYKKSASCFCYYDNKQFVSFVENLRLAYSR